MPIVTVVISAYNTEQYVGTAIDSILGQTMGDLELLVVDDGSKDRTLDVIRRYRDPRVKVLTQENAGKSVAVNRLLDVAAGSFLVLQDSDDWSSPDRLEKLVQAFRAQPELGMVFSGYALVLDGKVCAPRRAVGDIERCKQDIDDYTMPGLDPTMMVRTDIARATRFDPTLRIGQGLDFILKIGEKHPIIQIPDILYFYRFHYQSITKVDPGRKAKYLLQVTNAARIRRGLQPLAEAIFRQEMKSYLSDANNNLAGHFTDAAFWSVDRGFRMEAMQTALLSLRYAPSGGLKYAKPLIYSLLPRQLARSLRKKR